MSTSRFCVSVSVCLLTHREFLAQPHKRATVRIHWNLACVWRLRFDGNIICIRT
jgi:hypothetical protein